MAARPELTPRGLGPAGELIALGIDEMPGAAVVVFDRDFCYVLFRGQAVADNTRPTAQAEGQIASEVLPPERWAALEPVYRAALAGQTTMTEVESEDGQRSYLVRTAGVRNPVDGQIIGGASVVTDVTLVRSAERARLASERRSRLTFESAPIGMALEDLDGRFAEVNPALCQMLGRSAQWLLGRSLRDLLNPEDEVADRRLRDSIRSRELASGQGERCLMRPDGEVVWVLHSVGLLTDDHGVAQHHISHYLDITEARGARERMAHLATHDGLTGLLNRSGFLTAIAPILAHPARVGAGLALLFVDLDDFKDVNDWLGHSGGDLVLAEVGSRIRSALRGQDLVARFGGDEFVVLLTGLRRASDAQMIADQVHDRVGSVIEVDGHRIRVRLSIGLAVVGHDERADDALKRADLSMYRAKALGGGQTVLAS